MECSHFLSNLYHLIALTKPLTSLARCSCVFISDTCESLWLNRDHSAAPTCGMLLPPSIPFGNQHRVKMDCVSYFLYLLLNTFFFFLSIPKISFLLLLWDELPAARGIVKGLKPVPSCSWSGKWGWACGDQGIATKTVGRDPWSPLPVVAAGDGGTN